MKKYIVELTAEERKQLKQLVNCGKAQAYRIKHAQILLKAEQGKKGEDWTDQKIVEAFGCHVTTVENIRRRFVEQGLEAATTEQNPLYIGVAKANLAWLSFCHGNVDEVLREGSVALEQWRPFPYPLEWLARWPLLAVVLGQGRIADAVGHARAMLDPAQQRLPDAVTAILEKAVQAREGEEPGSAEQYLRQSIALAGEMGYL